MISTIINDIFLSCQNDSIILKNQVSHEYIPKEREKLGAFYSPERLIDLIIKNSLNKVIEQKISYIHKISDGKILSLNEKINAILSIKILDPSMGSGFFLIAAFHYILNLINQIITESNRASDGKIGLNVSNYNSSNEKEIPMLLIENCIHGIDIDSEAVLHVRAQFYELLINHEQILNPEYKEHIEKILNSNFKVGDALLEINWENSFDVIIGNPPWGIKYDVNDSKRKNDLTTRFPQANDYETYQFFAIWSIQLLNLNGYHAFIVPNTMIRNVLTKKFRQFLTYTGTLLKIFDFTNIETFSDPKVRCLIYIFQNAKYNDSKCEYMLMNSLSSYSYTKNIPYELLQREDDWNYLIREQNGVQNVIENIDKCSFKLDKIIDMKQGYIPYRLTTLTKRFGQEEAIRIRDQRLWHANDQKDQSYKRELRGRDITRYGLHWSGLWAKYGKHVSTYIDLKYFTEPRLLIREITGPLPKCLSVAYSDQEYLNNPSIIGVLMNDSELAGKYSIFFLLAVLNSKTLSYYFHYRCSKAEKGLFPKIIIQDIRNFPVPLINFDTPLEEKCNTFKEWQEKIKSFDHISQFIDVYGNKPLDKDVIHDLIAYLGELMMNNNEIDSKKASFNPKNCYYDEIIEFFICKLYGIEQKELMVS
jgi:tRNA1(Val) A37 N6-methylase TrmN6